MGFDLGELRRQAARTQGECAAVFHVSRRTWQRWESDPSSMPHGMWLEAVGWLERAVQIRKDPHMSIPTTVSKDTEANDSYDDSDLPFDWPEELKEFHPSKPVTNAQFIAYETEGREPYPGYAEELARWQDMNDQWQHRVLEAQGGDTDEPSEHVKVRPLPEGTPIINEITDPNDPECGTTQIIVPGEGEEDIQ
jgi:hypothetical protein